MEAVFALGLERDWVRVALGLVILGWVTLALGLALASVVIGSGADVDRDGVIAAGWFESDFPGAVGGDGLDPSPRAAALESTASPMPANTVRGFQSLVGTRLGTQLGQPLRP